MGYRIDYDKGTKQFEVTRNRPWRIWLLTAGCFGLFVLLCGWLWPEGSDIIRDLMIPGEDAVTVQAFSNLTDKLRTGTAVREAVTAFCREVLIGEPAAH